MTNKRTSISDIDTFKGTNLYKYQTRVHFNIVKDYKNLVSRWCDIRGKVSYEKARFILDTIFMTKEEYLAEHKTELDRSLADEKIFNFEYDYEYWQKLRDF